MQYVWQHRLWMPSDMRTVDGEPVEVIDPGLLNTDAGPDFFNAKVRIGDRLWAGNVEIHVRASDWKRHGHDTNPAYDTVILHVVERDDTRIFRPDGHPIPQLVMACAADFSRSYNEMVNRPGAELPCAAEIAGLPSIYLTDWFTALAHERLYAKADRIADYVGRLDGDWRQAVYVTLARGLGFGKNSDAFERLALATPISKLLRHQLDTVAIEGALFGQADLLPYNVGRPEGEYVSRLRQEHDFMAAKYGFTEPRNPGWMLARMRPQNFPHRRIAILAHMIAMGFQIGYDIFTVKDVADAERLFDIRLRGFWTNHYTFAPESGCTAKALGKASVTSLIINVVVPMLYAFGSRQGRPEMQERALEILQNLQPEDNMITRIFTGIGIPCPDAFTSQAMIELRRNYCEPRKCLYCRIGHRLLAAKAIRR